MRVGEIFAFFVRKHKTRLHRTKISTQLTQAHALFRLPLHRMISILFHVRVYSAFESEIALAILLGLTNLCSIAFSMESFGTLTPKTYLSFYYYHQDLYYCQLQIGSVHNILQHYKHNFSYTLKPTCCPSPIIIQRRNMSLASNYISVLVIGNFNFASGSFQIVSFAY